MIIITAAPTTTPITTTFLLRESRKQHKYFTLPQKWLNACTVDIKWWSVVGGVTAQVRSASCPPSTRLYGPLGQ